MSRGDLTRARILDEAMRLASQDGVQGLTIGTLADALHLSKSGLFAHFGSKEALQVAVLEHTTRRMQGLVAERIGRRPPGLAQFKIMIKAWLDWIDDPALPGGCPVAAACFEFDGQPGKTRDSLLAMQREMRAGLVRLVEVMAAQGELRAETSAEQFAFEVFAIVLGYHYASRLMSDPRARKHAEGAFKALLQRHAAEAPARRAV